MCFLSFFTEKITSIPNYVEVKDEPLFHVSENEQVSYVCICLQSRVVGTYDYADPLMIKTATE